MKRVVATVPVSAKVRGILGDHNAAREFMRALRQSKNGRLDCFSFGGTTFSTFKREACGRKG